MGSRYGGLKQLDGVGVHGETIMDYSVYDAVRAGFGKIVFVIRESFEQDFKDKVLSKYEGLVDTEIVFQSLNKIPRPELLNPEREKPWGTNHAIMMGKEVINEPFAVINADDFYGRDSFRIIADCLSNLTLVEKGKFCMVGYRLANTLSESGSVSRGVCETNAAGELQSVVERTHIVRDEDNIIKYKENETFYPLEDITPVSMNMWGFTPDYFSASEELFSKFIEENKDNLKAEFYIPSVVDTLIKSGQASVKVLDTPGKWFGVTYPEDRPSVVTKLKELTETGVYPEILY